MLNAIRSFSDLQHAERYDQWKKHAPKEDVEYDAIQKELTLELMQSHKTVERVVAAKEETDENGGR